jgi:CRISPR/Cas system-associated exonuclease Cas4 (RecB family)
VDDRRLNRARDQIARAATGIRAREFGATPDYLACSYCAFREICPSSVAR